MFTKQAAFLFFFSLLLYGCADDDFFQKDARVNEGNLTDEADSAWVTAGQHYDRSGFHRFFWGDHNRAIWAVPVKLPVFRLDSVSGGLRVKKMGGGYQTTSFHLQDKAGRLYAFRSLDKDPVHVITEFWQPTFVTNILRDQTSAANPYGVLIVPPLAEAVGVHHTNPRLFYVPPTDTSFGEYAPHVQGKLFMLEEKYEHKHDLTADFSGFRAFEDTDKALRNRFSHNTYHFDQHAFAKARLLDLLLGDWDRHKGQWEWAVRKEGADTFYEPIPKDRDQVFLKMKDGVIPFIATSKIMARKFHSFDGNFSDVKAYMINAKFIDERLLHGLSLQEWLRIARAMQAALTDDVIEDAVRRLPPAVYALAGEDLTQNLKSRRDLLEKAAAKMYRILAKSVTIPGSDEAEHFKVRRLDNERTEVRVTRPEDGNIAARQLYQRVFNRKETKEIILHGLAGDDTFELEGQVNEGIMIKVYGGLGEDKITDKSSVTGWKKYTQVYDTERGNEIEFGTETKDKTTRDVRVHAYDREGN